MTLFVQRAMNMRDVSSVIHSVNKTIYHALGPFVHHFDESEFEFGTETFYRHLVQILYSGNTIADGHDRITTRFQLGRQNRLYICFLLKDKARQKCNDFLWVIIG